MAGVERSSAIGPIGIEADAFAAADWVPAIVILSSRLYRSEQRLEFWCEPGFSLTALARVLRSNDKRLSVLEGNWL